MKSISKTFLLSVNGKPQKFQMGEQVAKELQINKLFYSI